jgi:hypothetical protein
LSSPYRETPKNAQKKSARAREKKLDARPRKTFFIMFLGFPYREALNQRSNKVERKKGQKFSRKKIPPKKYFPGEFLGNVLNCFPLVFELRFELPLPRNAEKRT